MTDNNFLTNDIIARTALTAFKNNLCLTKTANVQYKAEFTAGRGDVIRIDKPNNYKIREGSHANVQAIQERSTSMSIAFQDGVDLQISSKQRTLDLRHFNRTVLDPAMSALANRVDCRGIHAGLDAIYHSVGEVGKGANSFSAVNAAKTQLRKFGVQPNYVLMNEDDIAVLQDSLQNSFNTKLNKSISQKANIQELAGMEVYSSANMTVHNVGALGGSPIVNGDAQTGNVLKTTGWTANKAVLKKGDIFYMDGVMSVNPSTQQITGAGNINLQRFIVLSDANSDDKGNAEIRISPSIVTQGPYQNVNKAPKNKAKLTIYGKSNGTFANNFIYSREAFSLACVKLEEPRGATFAKTISDRETGLSIRMIEGYDVITDISTIRFDIMYGWLCNPEYAVRLVG